MGGEFSLRGVGDLDNLVCPPINGRIVEVSGKEVKMEGQYLILVWFTLSWIMKYLKLRCMIIWRVYMHVRFVINCVLVLLSYYRVLVSWLWSYLEQEFWTLWSVGLMIRWTFTDCGCSSCSVDQLHGRDGLFWKQYIIWCLMGVRDGHGTWVFVIYNMELELMRRYFYGRIGLFWRTSILVSSLVPNGFPMAKYLKKFRVPKLIIVEL